MAYVESAVVVYLRAIFHPEGFKLPLKTITDSKIFVEVAREAATIFMLLSIAFIAGSRCWERFAYFIMAFGIWDIFYYVWLKVLLDWPSSIFAWDILFLIPLPWIGPVIAPLSVSFLMIIFGFIILHSIEKGDDFKPTVTAHILGLTGIFMILYSFMYDLPATLHNEMPRPYRYGLLIAGNVLLIISFIISYVKSVRVK